MCMYVCTWTMSYEGSRSGIFRTRFLISTSFPFEKPSMRPPTPHFMFERLVVPSFRKYHWVLLALTLDADTSPDILARSSGSTDSVGLARVQRLRRRNFGSDGRSEMLANTSGVNFLSISPLCSTRTLWIFAYRVRGLAGEICASRVPIVSR